jgi:hypothetical protein
MFPELISATQMQWLLYSLYLLLPSVVICNIVGTIDLFLLLTFTLLRNWNTSILVSQAYDFRPLLSIIGSLLGAFVLSRVTKLQVWRRSRSNRDLGDKGAKPFLFPARTTHTRLLPKVHSSSFSYLSVGVPVGWQDSAGGMLATDHEIYDPRNSRNKSWYTVCATDYLYRGNSFLGLKGKLRSYLQSIVSTIPALFGPELIILRVLITRTTLMRILLLLQSSLTTQLTPSLSGISTPLTEI